MKCTVIFLLLNDDYSVEHAEANGIEESSINRKYEWRDEMKITTDVVDVTERTNENYTLKGQLESGDDFSYDISSMHLFYLNGESPIIIGCSEILYDSASISSDNEMVISIIMKDYQPFANPVPGIYISTGDFPKELIS